MDKSFLVHRSYYPCDSFCGKYCIFCMYTDHTVSTLTNISMDFVNEQKDNKKYMLETVIIIIIIKVYSVKYTNVFWHSPTFAGSDTEEYLAIWDLTPRDWARSLAVGSPETVVPSATSRRKTASLSSAPSRMVLTMERHCALPSRSAWPWSPPA
ncbi:hypothetical protein JZ751_008606 [Albula glossodonta]|uniref:Uncharacterized protein n=1 Tax=Albula glossodonta TaxID=121402 RepID=A0A8T2P773_9TELE|nr:hypothetical protein JZ751_008606 [Albula glossodonta]